MEHGSPNPTDYILAAVAIASLLLVAFIVVFWLIFGLAATGSNGMSRFESIALYVWIASIIATIYLFGKSLFRRRYGVAILTSWIPIIIFVVLVYSHEWLIR